MSMIMRTVLEFIQAVTTAAIDTMPCAVGAASSCPRKFGLTSDITQLGVCHAPAPTGYVSPRGNLP